MDTNQNGSFQVGSNGVRFAAITDGLSNTIFAGEKHVQINQFGVGWNDCSTYNGDYSWCSTRSGGPDYPLARSPYETGWKFGSYHTSTCQFVFGDGSVRGLPIGINPYVLGLLAHINDGQVIPDY